MGDAAERAARLTDPVGHGLGMLGLIGGALIGAAVGAFMILTLPVSAPLLVGALVGVAAVGAVAGGALAGDQLMHGLQTAFALPDPTTGMIGIVGSLNVLVGGLPAARAIADAAAVCNGLFSLNHLPIPAFGPPASIAEGSSTVLINSLPAARVSSKLICGGEIKDGCPTVVIGGETVRVLPVHDLEAEMQQFFGTLLKTSLIAAGVLTFFMGGEAILTFAAVFGGFYVANEALGQLGNAIGPGWSDILQGGFGLAAIVGGARLGTVEEDTGALNERCPCGEPVDAVTGEVFTSTVDFDLPGSLPIRFVRGYASSLRQQSWLGPNWCCSWGQSVQLAGPGTVLYFPGDGQKVRFELGDADSEGWIRSPKVDKLRLRLTSRGFEVRNQQNHILTFAQRRENALLLSSIADLNGNAIHFNYYSGILRTVIHTGGYRLHVDATASHISGIALEQSDGSVVSLVRYEYDSKGQLQGVDNGSGRMLRYEYDDAARMTGWQDRQETWYRYRYDEEGRCAESVGPGGIYHYRYAYDRASRSTIAINSYGATNTFQYNEYKRVVAEQDPMGGTTYTEWDERGNKLSVTDPEGRRVGYEYDSDGNLVASTDSSGRTIKIEHNQLGLPVLLVDASGKRWVRKYDMRGNLIEAGREDEASWRYERDSRGNLVRIIDPAGRSREFGYNAAGLPIVVSDWQGNRTRYLRDNFGRVIYEKDPLDSETRFTYNAINKLADVILPNGAQIQWGYDFEGNLTARTGPDGATYFYSYGPFDTRQSIIRPSGATLRFHHDFETRLTAVENEKGEQWKYTYDPVGRVIEEQDFAGRKQAFEYDRSGLCIKRINSKGDVTEIKRNQAGQIVRTKASDGAVTTFEYDANGLISGATNQWIAVKLERDEYGRIGREIQGDRVIESTYDERGLRTKRRTSEGQETRWSYDANGRVRQIGFLEDEWLDFVRDAMGRDLERHFRQEKQNANHTKPGGIVLRQNYDPLHRLTSQWAGLEAGASKAVTAIAERQYSYDLNSNPTEIYDKYWGTSRYHYDRDGRIASAQREQGPSEAFQYDVSGNISAVLKGVAREEVPALEGRGLGLGGRREQVGNTSYLYDEDSRVIQKSERHPGRTERVWKFEWTSEDQLRSVLNYKGELWKYEYDAFGRRTRKIGPDTSTTYVWDGNVVAEEIHTTHTSLSTNFWIFEPKSFRPVAKLENGTAYACVLDQIGTPKELISTDGTLAWSTQLSTWGEVELEQISETDCPIRFQGQWFDEESGLHYNRFRYYDPGTGSYLSPDPIGLEGGTRTFGYVHNPISWVDPQGLAGACGLPTDQPLDWSRPSPRTGGDAADHVVTNHGQLSLTKPQQGVFYGDPIAATNDAWAIAGEQNITPISDGYADTYIVPRPNSGYSGGMGGQGQTLDYVTIVTEQGTNRIITAYPSGATPSFPRGYIPFSGTP